LLSGRMVGLGRLVKNGAIGLNQPSEEPSGAVTQRHSRMNASRRRTVLC
jgi:hypothetical protein